MAFLKENKAGQDNRRNVFVLVCFVILLFSLSVQAAQVQIRIATGNDDAEQSLSNGAMYLGSEGSSSGFLELGYYVWRRNAGLRFQNVAIPQGSTINSAVVELTASATDSTNTRLVVTAEAADNAAAFTSANNNISSRTPTAFNVDWNVSNWTNGNTYQTPDITSAIQEIVSRAGWASGNSMVVIIGPDTACSNANCDRRAEEFESGAGNAALLIVDYTPPVVSEHFSISHDGNADTCNVESVTISKHDMSHAVETGYAGTITLSTSTGNGVWSLITGSGTLTDLGGGGADYVFAAADNGQVELGLRNSVTETLNINVSDGSWNENTGEDADLSFAGSVSETYRDEFTTVTHSGSNGTQAWSGDWNEISDGGSASGGDVQVDPDQGNNRLHIQDDGNGVWRELDLSSYTGATALLSFDYRRDSFEASNEYVTIEVSNNAGVTWVELDRFSGPADDAAYLSVNYDVSAYMAANTQIRFMSSGAMSNWDDIYIDNVEIAVTSTSVCPSTDHFVINHDGLGISCVAEPVAITAALVDGSTDTGYAGTIMLDTQSGTGSWALVGGSGSFTDATADDGLATYTFVPADNGVASFNLDYQGGTPSINIDAYEGAVRDDDTEGDLLFSPFGFTVTEAALVPPFSGVLNTAVLPKISASSFKLYLALYGQSPTDPSCGIIEDYNGAKNIKFWSNYNDPVTGSVPVKVNTLDVETNEATATEQSIDFLNGQSSIDIDYRDVGDIKLWLKDDTVTAVILTGIRGASDDFVVKPAGFVLSDIKRTSDSVNNPGTAVDENGAAFIAAGNDFSVTVKAVNALGNTTPNYGQEITPESVLLTPTLVAAGAAENPSIGLSTGTGFDGFILGEDTGTDFYWNEVGIITLTPSVADGDYLVTGDVPGTASENVGRFYPDHFVTAKDDGIFQNKCLGANPFTYLGDSFKYTVGGNPTITVTALGSQSAAPLKNYTGAWAKLTTAGISLTYPSADNAQVDQGGANPIVVIASEGTHERVDNAGGTLTFALGKTSEDTFAYARNLGQVEPFTADLSIQLTAVTDGEASAVADLTPPKNITPNGNSQRFGRGYAQDVNGTMSLNGNTLNMPIGSWFYDVGGIWTLNSDDSCSIYSYTKVDAGGIATTSAPPTDVTLSNGAGNLDLTISGDAPAGGTSTINTVWPTWLQYEDDETDQLSDGNVYDDNPSATATFGIFRGEDRYLYWREAP